MTTALTRNPVGQLVSLNDTRGGLAWFTPAGTTETVQPSVHGQWWTHQGPGGQSQTYTYDAAGRLSKAIDPTGSGCQVRVYGFDADSNRTSLSGYNDTTTGCQTATVSSTVSSSFDAADRLLPASGASTPHYDTFGRIDSISDGLVTGTGALSVGYYANDLVRSQGQNGSIMCWALDAQQRRSTYTTYSGTGCVGTPAAQKINHYSDASSDNPDWIAETADGTSWTAYVPDLIGNLAVSVAGTSTSTAATYEYTNLHGDVIGTADAGAPSPTLTAQTDEYGNTLYGGTAAGRYGWLGGKQRSEEDLAGLTLMGARLYNPTLGRFLSVDPVPGGSANDYDYTNQDPINSFDLDGRCSSCVSEWAASFGDTVTFGGTKQIRRLINHELNGRDDDMVNHHSDFYRWGSRGGFIASFFDIPAGIGEGLERLGLRRGGEIITGRKGRRIAPLGGSKPRSWQEWLPHYHRRHPRPGGGIGRHRPWQNPAPGQSFWSRF